MQIVQFILVAVEVVSCLLLIVLILAQKSKSEGLGLAFGSGMGEALFGSRAGNILTKLTIGFTVVFLVNTLLLSLVYSGARGRSLMERYLGRPTPVRTAPPPAQRGERPAPAAQPALPSAGAPTLPGTDLDGGDIPADAPSGAE